MKVIILAGGFGTILDRGICEELERNPQSEYGAFLGLSKFLVRVEGKALVDYWMEMFRECPEIDGIYVLTNGLHEPQFISWAEQSGFPLENIVSNGVMTNEKRWGAVRDIYHAVQEKKIDDDLLVVSSDLMFKRGFDLKQALAYFSAKGGDVVTTHLVPEELVSKTGILELDPHGQILDFLEHPSLDRTKSRQACPPFYVYRRSTVNGRLPEFVREKEPEGLSAVDSPGLFVKWLFSREPVYAFAVEGRYDTGNLEGLKKTYAEMRV